MQLGWENVTQALLLAACTWYMRRGSRKDREDIKRSTSSSNDIAQIWIEVRSMRLDFEAFKREHYDKQLKG